MIWLELAALWLRTAKEFEIFHIMPNIQYEVYSIIV